MTGLPCFSSCLLGWCFAGLQEGHHPAEFFANLFDLGIGVLLAHGDKRLAAGLVFVDPVLRPGAVLDVGQDLHPSHHACDRQ